MSSQYSTGKRYSGLASGIVKDVNDPTKEGRVKVTYQWGEVSGWCRMAQLYAGSGYGTLWTPEVKDEVILAFIHGDQQSPVVLGGLYNGQDKPLVHRSDGADTKLGAVSDVKMLRTKAGHEIRFDDQGGQEQIMIVDKTGTQKITLDAVGNKITIEAQSDVLVQSTTGKLTLQGKTGVDLISEAGMNIQASATLTVSGSTVNIN